MRRNYSHTRHNGKPTGRVHKPRTLEAAKGIEDILKAIRKAELDSDDALRIVQVLKGLEAESPNLALHKGK